MGLLKILRIWLIIDFSIILTIWFANKVIRPRYPEWWQDHVVAKDPYWQDDRSPMSKIMRRWLNRHGKYN